MKLCKDCNPKTIKCVFCKYSRQATVEETDELLWCTTKGVGVDVIDSYNSFYCSHYNKEVLSGK